MGQLIEGNEYQRLLRAAAASGIIGTFEWDVQRDLLYADANTAAVFCVDEKLAAAGLPQEHYMKAVHPDDFGFLASSVQETVAYRTAFECEYRVIQTNKSIKTVLGRGRCDVDEKGRPTWFRGILIDVTARDHRKQGSQNDVKEHCIAIREFGMHAGDDLLVHLVDMILLHIANGPALASTRRADAH